MSLPSENEPAKEKRNALEELENRLYSRTPPPLRHDEEFLGEEKHIRIAPGLTAEAERKDSALYSIFATVMPWLQRLLIASILFFLFAAGLGLYGFWRGGNTVSPQNITIQIQGPVGAAAGEETAIEVTVGNDNTLPLDAVDLLVEYPSDTRRAGDLASSLPRYRDSLGPLASGERVARRLSFVPFGEEGEKKTIGVTVEYRPKDSSGTFSKNASYEFAINSAPVTLRVMMPKKVNSDQIFEIALEVNSNSSAVQRNLLVKGQYPFGFQFGESTPSPSFAKDTWELGDLKPQSKRVIQIKGKVEATEESERTFRFSIGTQSAKDEKRIGTIFLSEAPTVAVRRPFISLDVLVNGEQGKTFVARSGQTVRADIAWANNLPTKIADMEITAELSGSIYNRSAVSAANGYYDSNTNTVRWDQERVARFGAVEPGEDGTQSMSVALLPIATNPALYDNPQLTIAVTARGKRLDEQGLYQNVSMSVVKEVKIATTLALSARLFHEGGFFTSSGPVPPKAEQETEYTVVWSLSNSSNGVADAKVSALLPSYVTWLDRVNPPSETVRYNPVGGGVVWDVGEVEAGVGVGTPPREVSFQISIRPSLSQVGAALALVGDTSASGEDRFTGTTVVSNARSALTTGTLSDVGASPQSGVVTK